MTKLHTTCQPDIYYTYLDELPAQIQYKLYKRTLLYERSEIFDDHHFKVEVPRVKIDDKIFSVEMTVAHGRLGDIDRYDLKMMAEDILGDDAGHLTVYLTEL